MSVKRYCRCLHKILLCQSKSLPQVANFTLQSRCFSINHKSSSKDKSSSYNWKKISLLASSYLGLAVLWNTYSKKDNTYFLYLLPRNSTVPAKPQSGLSDNRFKYNFIADVVENVAPSVVFIETHDDLPFFGGLVAVASGSGFFVKEDGHIITNAHVVANRRKVIVKLSDGRSFEGAVLCIDTDVDLALIKISCKSLPFLHLGKSRDIRPGEWAIALGSPLSLTNTITVGVVSSTQRSSDELGLSHGMEYIQTDAAINVGNSGGPLVNLDGEVIGVNNIKVAPGISFAIPSQYVDDFLERAERSLKNQKNISREAYFGFKLLSLSSTIINVLQQHHPDFPDVDGGVLVSQVIIGSPAHIGGLQPMDVIVSANGKKVLTSKEIFSLASEAKPVELEIRRGKLVVKTIINPVVY